MQCQVKCILNFTSDILSHLRVLDIKAVTRNFIFIYHASSWNYNLTLFRVLINITNIHDIISSSWLSKKMRVILTKFSPRLTPEENATHCVVLKVHISINFQFERHKTDHNTLIISRENRTTWCSSKTSYMSRWKCFDQINCSFI